MEAEALRRFAGQHSVVIGGATGIGRATCIRLAREGAHVTVADWNTDDGQATASKVGGTFFHVDARADADIQTLSEETIGASSVICCVGRQSVSSIACVDTAEWVQLVDANTLPAILTTKHFSRMMVAGSITLVASVAGLTSGGPGLAAYGATKAAVIGWTRSAALELAPTIRVNCVCPGWTDTPFNAPVLELIEADEIDLTIPLGRQAKPHEIAAAISFIASTDASYLTGAVLVVDGGLSV